MPRIGAYRRSKKLYGMGDEYFVKPTYWPDTIEASDGTILGKTKLVMWRGKPTGYNYEVETFGDKDPSLADSDVYEEWGGPPEKHIYESDGTIYVEPAGWPETIDLNDGTILSKEMHKTKAGKRYASYYVETWGDLDPSLPSSEVYEGEFEEEE